MKKNIALASAAFIAASGASQAEIVINDFLSFEGFVDMSYSHTDIDYDGIGVDGGSSDSWAIDQVEISWLFDFDTVTAQIDLEHTQNNSEDDDGQVVEQAFATYHLDGGAAITAGRYASMIGFEAFEPTGLYQYSFAYDYGFGDATVIPGYSQGIKFTSESDTTFFGISLQDSAFDNDDDSFGGSGDSTWGLEVAGSINFENGLAWFVGGAYEDGDADDSDNFMLNTYVTFETGAWIFAAELNYGEFEGGQALADAASVAGEEEVIQALLMANMAYSEQGSVTGRISYGDHEVDLAGPDAEADFLKFTLAHGWAFTDNLFLVNEISYVDGEIADEDYEALVGAVELIFSF